MQTFFDCFCVHPILALLLLPVAGLLLGFLLVVAEDCEALDSTVEVWKIDKPLTSQILQLPNQARIRRVFYHCRAVIRYMIVAQNEVQQTNASTKMTLFKTTCIRPLIVTSTLGNVLTSTHVSYPVCVFIIFECTHFTITNMQLSI